MKKILKYLLFVMTTLLLIVITRYVMVLLHEWTHGTVAWLLGVKSNPFNIYYGDWTLLQVDEAVNYLQLYNSGRIWAVASIAITPIIINTLLYLSSLLIISRASIQKRKLTYQFSFWFALMNLGEVYAYIPIRTFGTHGDVGNFIRDLNLSPWLIYLPGTLLVGIATWYFLKYILPRAYYHLNILSLWLCSFYLFLVLIVYFFFFGLAGANTYGIVSHVFSWTSVALIPVFFVIFFPSRNWVVTEIETMNKAIE